MEFEKDHFRKIPDVRFLASVFAVIYSFSTSFDYFHFAS